MNKPDELAVLCTKHAAERMHSPGALGWGCGMAAMYDMGLECEAQA